MENAGDYRDEKTGELHGLSRVRSFTNDKGFIVYLHNPTQVAEEDYAYTAIYTIPTYSGNWDSSNLRGQVLTDTP